MAKVLDFSGYVMVVDISDMLKEDMLLRQWIYGVMAVDMVDLEDPPRIWYGKSYVCCSGYGGKTFETARQLLPKGTVGAAAEAV